MTNGLDILLLEDDVDAREGLCDILALDRHRVLVAGSIGEARELAKGNDVSVVILDRKLPDGMVDEFIPELRELLPSARIIVATAYADMESTIIALRAGVADYILKPIDPDALRRSLDRYARQQRLEAELRDEHQFAESLLRKAEAIVLVLGLDGSIQRFNPYFERVFGWPLDELCGQDWFAHCLPEPDRDWVRETFDRTAAELETEGVVNPVLTKNGRERQVRWSNTVLKDDQGAAKSILAVGIDVTDLMSAQERALQAQRLASIGQTMTALAHESRNAIQRIRACVEMLELDLAEKPETHRDLSGINRAANDLQALLEEVRSFAAPINLRLTRCNLREIIDRTWRDLAVSRKGRDVTLVCPGDNEPPSMTFDEQRIERVFRNLFENSLAACTDPVAISITYSIVDDEMLQVIVADNGPGLNAEQREKLFEPFFTTKSSGTGLGMSIVRRIIEAHGGTISVVDEVQNGAAFAIHFPLNTNTSTVD